jgi:hypothetical protein
MFHANHHKTAQAKIVSVLNIMSFILYARTCVSFCLSMTISYLIIVVPFLLSLTTLRCFANPFADSFPFYF